MIIFNFLIIFCFQGSWRYSTIRHHGSIQHKTCWTGIPFFSGIVVIKTICFVFSVLWAADRWTRAPEWSWRKSRRSRKAVHWSSKTEPKWRAARRWCSSLWTADVSTPQIHFIRNYLELSFKVAYILRFLLEFGISNSIRIWQSKLFFE